MDLPEFTSHIFSHNRSGKYIDLGLVINCIIRWYLFFLSHSLRANQIPMDTRNTLTQNRNIMTYLLTFVLLTVFWLLLSAPFSMQEFAVGLLVSALITLLTSGFQRKLAASFSLSPRKILSAFSFTGIFISELIKSNIDVALRVINPRLPVNPGIVRVKTKLKSPLGRIILANAITLTPGTLTVDTDGEDFYIHWIDITSDSVKAATAEIVEKFEKHLEVVFG